jgi:hypothetical protein
MTEKKVLWSPWFWLVVAVCGLLTWMGYDKLNPTKYYPVEGTVLLDGEPFVPELLLDDHRDFNLRAGFVPDTSYRVYFTPLSAGWPRNFFRCWSELDRKGRYRLVTDLKTLEYENPLSERRQAPRGKALERLDTVAGAALGWYEVTITHLLESETGGDIMGDRLRKTLGLKHRTTPYRIEVVEHPEPGHYDIKLETYLGTGKAREGVKK